MAQRYDFYFRQKVTESELDGAFDGLENADFNQFVDSGLTGIFSGITAGEASVPDLTVDVAAGTAYSKAGERIRVGSTQNVDVSQDENSVTTTVAGASNSKVISVYIEFERTLSDPRTDGNSSTVQFSRAEGFQFVVRQGSEATTPGSGSEVAFITTNAPALDSGLLLVCDIIRDFGQTTITNSDIYTARTEYPFDITAGAINVTAGTPEAAAQGVLTELNNHVTGVANAHDADVIDFDNASVPAAWTALAAATTVQEALDGIYTDLAQSDGSSLIGASVTPTWADGTGVTSSTVETALEEIVSDLASTTGGASGAQKVGFDGAAFGITSTNVADALDEIANETGRLAGANTWTGLNYFKRNTQMRTHSDGTWELNSLRETQSFANDGTVSNSGSSSYLIEIADDGGSITNSTRLGILVPPGYCALIRLHVVASYTENSSDYDEFWGSVTYRVTNTGGTFSTDVVGTATQETVLGASFITFTLNAGSSTSVGQARLNLTHGGGGSGGDYRATGWFEGIALPRA